jgi:putative peptidoglycan lipid II flippase
VPVLVGVLGAAIYAAVAFATVGRFGMPGLVLANTLQNSAHAVVLLALLWRAAGGLGAQRIGPAALRIVVAGALMAASIGALLQVVPVPSGTLWLVLYLALAAGVGGLAYLALLAALRSEELELARQLVAGRLRRPAGVSP